MVQVELVGQQMLPLEYSRWRVRVAIECDYETIVDDDAGVRRIFRVIDGDGPDGSMRRIGVLHSV